MSKWVPPITIYLRHYYRGPTKTPMTIQIMIILFKSGVWST